MRVKKHYARVVYINANSFVFVEHQVVGLVVLSSEDQ